MLLYGLSEASTAGSFTAAGVLGWLIGAAVCLVAFVFYSLARRDNAVVNVRLFREPTFASSTALMFIVAVGLFGGLLLLPLYFQVVRGQGALNAGLLLAPQGLGAMVMTPVSGLITDRYGPRYIIPFGLVLVILGTLPFTVVQAHTSYGYLIAALVVRGLGIGACMMPVFAAAFRRLPRERVPQASTTLSAVMQVGGSFGAAVLVMALTRRIGSNLAAHGLSASGGSMSGLAHLPAALLAKVAPLLADGFGYAFWYALVATAIGLVPAAVLVWRGDGGPAVAGGETREEREDEVPDSAVPSGGMPGGGVPRGAG
jgi:predicted MFS family arabinose efflux permease